MAPIWRHAAEPYRDLSRDAKAVRASRQERQPSLTGGTTTAVPFDQMEGVIWFDGKLVPGPDAKIHVLTHGLHYASAVFEGERAYNGMIFKSTGAFRAAEAFRRHARFRDSLFGRRNRCRQAAGRRERNDQPNAYVRPIAWRGSEQLGVSARHNTIHLAIATWEWPSYFDPAQRLKGIRLDLADYRRPDPRTAPCLAKAAGLYMICTISKHRAERRGYADAMMLDWEERVAECTGANIFFIKRRQNPHADRRLFLGGITRRTAIDLASARHRGDRTPHPAGRTRQASRNASSPAPPPKSPRCRRSPTGASLPAPSPGNSWMITPPRCSPKARPRRRSV